MAAAAKLLIDIAADIAKLRTDFSAAQKIVGDFGSSVTRMGASFKNAMGALAIGGALAGLKSFIDSVGGIADAADKVQLSTDSFQALTAAMRDAGIAGETSVNLLAKAGQTLGKAFDGNKEAVELMQRLGVGLIDAQGNAASFEQTLPRIAKAILAIENPMQRASAAAAFFGGKVGKEAIPALEAMAKGTEKLKNEFATQVIPEETVRRFDAFGDSLNRLKVEGVARLAQMLDSLVTPDTIRAWDDAKRAWQGLSGTVKSDAEGSWWPTTYINLTNAARGLERIAGWAKDAAAAWRDFSLASSGGVAAAAGGAAGGAVSGIGAILLPPVVVTPEMDKFRKDAAGVSTAPPNDPFKGFPRIVGGGGAAGVDKFAEAMKRLAEETKSTQAAFDSFNRSLGSGIPFEEAERLAKQVEERGELISKMIKNVPAGQQQPVIDAANSLSTLKEKFDDLKTVVEFAKGVNAEFGDGTKQLADQTYFLNQAYAKGKITIEEYTAAMDAARQAADQQKLAQEALAGGMASVSAGFRQAATQMTQAQADTQLGADLYNATLDTMSAAISEFVQTGQLDFQKLAQSFAAMLIEMAARWAAASLLRAAFSSFGGGGGLFDFGGGQQYGPPAPARAMGGPVSAGQAYVVGERGPELFIPSSSGWIDPGTGGGGGVGVTVNITNNAPAKVSATEGRDSQGRPRIDVLIEAVETGLAGRMARGQGALGKVIEGQYGVQKRGR